MNIVIIEDEKLVADDLYSILQNLDNNIQIDAVLSSVTEAVSFFNNNKLPHLIFSDIQLGDGYSFEIFKEIKNTVPVIYCTAFNQHALQAFENNGISYVLKPYTSEMIKSAFNKYQLLKQTFTTASEINYDALLSWFTNKTSKPTTFLVNYKNKIIPIKYEDVVLFSIENKETALITSGSKKYTINNTLEELENACDTNFYRASRQLLINKKYIKDVIHYGFRKLFVNLTVESGHEIIINKTKATDFLNWLKQ